MTRIMLDPGHAGDRYNAGAVDGYFESSMTWSLAQRLKRALEVRGFEVALTRQSMGEDPELTERGRRAVGCDLFLSLHSNAAASAAPDAPWMIHLLPDAKTDVDEESERVARALGPVISRVMGVSEATYHTKGAGFDRDGNGTVDDEYYGVLFGAKSVGVPAVIIEHSFHTNASACRWLMDEENLDALAEAEARCLARYYKTEDDVMDEEKSELQRRIDALTARVEALEDQVKPRWAYIDSNTPSWAHDTMKKLRDRGILKGNGENSYEMSRLLMRIMVMLDRAGLFG